MILEHPSFGPLARPLIPHYRLYSSIAGAGDATKQGAPHEFNFKEGRHDLLFSPELFSAILHSHCIGLNSLDSVKETQYRV